MGAPVRQADHHSVREGGPPPGLLRLRYAPPSSPPAPPIGPIGLTLALVINIMDARVPREWLCLTLSCLIAGLLGLCSGKAMAKYQGTEWEFILAIDAIAYQRDAYLTKAMLENIFGTLFPRLFAAMWIAVEDFPAVSAASSACISVGRPWVNLRP